MVFFVLWRVCLTHVDLPRHGASVTEIVEPCCAAAALNGYLICGSSWPCGVCENTRAMGTVRQTIKDSHGAGFVSGGAYVAGGGNVYAQSMFLQAVERCVPEAIAALGAASHNEAGLRKWAEHWGLSYPWALRSARLWVQYPDVPGMFGSVSRALWEPGVLHGPSWDPIKETEAEFRSRVDAYIAACRRAVGVKPASDKSNPLHFEWLALHHVGRWTLQRIVERSRNESTAPDASDVSRAIAETAALVGLTLRRGRQAKPPAES